MAFFKAIPDPGSDEMILPPAYARDILNSKFVDKEVTVTHNGATQVWILKLKKGADNKVAFTNGWKEVVKSLQIKEPSLLVFTHCEPVADFLISVFSVSASRKEKQRVNLCFSNIYGDKMLSFAYIMDEPKHSLMVDVIKYKGRYMFEAGWDEVVKEIPLEFGSLVVFQYRGNRTFKFTVFDANGKLQSFSKKVDKDGNPDIGKGKGKVVEAEEVKTNGDKNGGVHVAKVKKRKGEAKNVGYDVEEVSLEENEDSPYVYTVPKNKIMRLPVIYARKLEVERYLRVKVINLAGKAVRMEIRCEKLRNGYRYAMKNWASFLGANGIKVGDNCTFLLNSSERAIRLINVKKHKRNK